MQPPDSGLKARHAVEVDRESFQAVVVEIGKWLRDRFFGTAAVKSAHGFERLEGLRVHRAGALRRERIRLHQE